MTDSPTTRRSGESGQPGERPGGSPHASTGGADKFPSDFLYSLWIDSQSLASHPMYLPTAQTTSKQPEEPYPACSCSRCYTPEGR